jgi:maleate isomerase
MYSSKIEPKFSKELNSKIGLITLASDYTIEKDFNNVISGMNIDLFVNRIRSYSPLTSENLIKMSNTVTDVSKDILPNESLDCVVYGCTSGTIATGYEKIKNKINLAKPLAKVTTPSTAALNALKKMNIKKLSIFTPYPKDLNNEVIKYFEENGFTITNNLYFDISDDIEIGKVDQKYLFDVLLNMDHKSSDALFVSCTALPVLSMIDDLEKKLEKTVLSSNQVLIWDTLQSIGKKENINGFGKLFKNK